MIYQVLRVVKHQLYKVKPYVCIMIIRFYQYVWSLKGLPLAVDSFRVAFSRRQKKSLTNGCNYFYQYNFVFLHRSQFLAWVFFLKLILLKKTLRTHVLTFMLWSDTVGLSILFGTLTFFTYKAGAAFPADTCRSTGKRNRGTVWK